MPFIVYMNGNRICPKCAGMMVRYGGELHYRCLDCNTHYEITGMESKKEFVLEEIKREQIQDTY